MALVDYQPETRVIPFKGGSFAVKGLSLSDITNLVRYHLPDLEALFEIGDKALGGKVDITEEDVGKIALAVAEQAPGFMANLIALAAEESSEEGIQAASKLPFPVQVMTLVTIADLTFSEVGGVKKALESVAGLLKQATPDQVQTAKAALNSIR